MSLQKMLFLALAIITHVDCAKIVIMATTPSPSLFNLFVPIIEQLSSRKHEITVQSMFSLKKPLANVKELKMQPPSFGGNEKETKDFLMHMTKSGPISEVYAFTDAFVQICKEFMTDSSTKVLQDAGNQFDLALVDGFSECSIVFASLVAKHVVTLLGSGNSPWVYSDLPSPPSYVPNYFRRIPSKMTFYERLMNTIDVTGFRLINDFVMEPATNRKLKEYLPHAPTGSEGRAQVALELANHDPVMYSPRPSMPNIIFCGGLHCREAKPLPKDLNDFVESSGNDGFIVFSLGTNMKSTFLPIETRNAILSALSRLKQKVIWKFEAKLTDLPKNVKITQWMPQQDLLGHPKARLFITHSGLLSLQEAIYHGVPVIGMPFFMDQSGNIARVLELEIGGYIDFFNVTADGFYELITKLLTDNRYRENMKKYSAIFRDQPIKPLDKAIFWIEYVLRHDGASHFRPAGRDLNFFQYFLLDVIAFLLLITATSLGVVAFVARLLLKKLFTKKQTGYLQDKKRK